MFKYFNKYLNMHIKKPLHKVSILNHFVFLLYDVFMLGRYVLWYEWEILIFKWFKIRKY